MCEVLYDEAAIQGLWGCICPDCAGQTVMWLMHGGPSAKRLPGGGEGELLVPQAKGNVMGVA